MRERKGLFFVFEAEQGESKIHGFEIWNGVGNPINPHKPRNMVLR
jgi:hypothetical protein